MKNKSNTRLVFILEECIRETDDGKILNQAMTELGLSFSDIPDETKLNVFFTNSFQNTKNHKVKNKIIVAPKGIVVKAGYLVELDFRSYEEILIFLKGLIAAEWWSSLNFKLKDSEKKLETIKNKNLSSDKNVIAVLSQEIEMITDLGLVLLREDDLDKWNLLIKNFCKKNHLFNTITLAKEKDLIHDENILDTHSLIFQLPIGTYFLVIKDKNILKQEEEFKVELLVLIIMRSMQNIDYLDSKDFGEIEFWKKIFSKIPYPMAVISPLGELLIYNQHFATVGILPRECLSYKDNDYIEISQQHYKLKRFDFSFHGSMVHYYIFYTSEKIMNNPNNELGIVSSSIAHELNNPLAGILAALSLLRLENNWSDEALLEIDEMKEGAKRCKELVEIFLGFSRMSPKNSGESSLRSSLDQAINLLRFRMVESDLRIDMKLNTKGDDLSFDINASVLSMVFYLILNELMTAFAHHRLLTPKSSSLLEGKVTGAPHQVQFILNEEFEYEKNILDSKLLQYLLFFEKLEIVFLKKEIRLLKIYK